MSLSIQLKIKIHENMKEMRKEKKTNWKIDVMDSSSKNTALEKYQRRS